MKRKKFLHIYSHFTKGERLGSANLSLLFREKRVYVSEIQIKTLDWDTDFEAISIKVTLL